MTLSDPRDTTKPDPWSLGSSFDLHYGLGGMNEVALEDGGSNIHNPGLFVSDGQLMHADPVSGPSSSPRVANSGPSGLGASSDHAIRSRRKLKALDEEESGADAQPQDPETERGLRDATTSAPPNVYRNDPSEASPLPSSSNQYRYQSTGTNLDFSAGRI